jgi:hypothetical protein
VSGDQVAVLSKEALRLKAPRVMQRLDQECEQALSCWLGWRNG